MRPVGEMEFVEGLAALQARHLTFDALVYHTQMAALIDLAKTFPQTSIILNHIGRPLGIGPYLCKI